MVYAYMVHIVDIGGNLVFARVDCAKLQCSAAWALV